jgi:hypothetical protein
MEQFMAWMPELAQRPVRKSEEPDFLLYLPTHVLGVELTDLFQQPLANGRPRQEQEALREKVVDRARALYQALADARRGLPVLYVSVYFNTRHILNRRSVEPLATQRLPVAGEGGTWTHDGHARDELPEALARLEARCVPGLRATFFASPDAGYVAPLTRADVERVLAAKEGKVHRYRRQCDEVWLVVSFDRGRLSTLFEPGEEALASQYVSGFDRVFLLRQVRNELHELRLVRDAVRHSRTA